MRQITFIFIFVLISFAVYAQETQDVVYLKNGSIIKGQITEMIPDKHVKIETSDGNILVYSFAEIEKVEKVKITVSSTSKDMAGTTGEGLFSDYYTQSSLGVAIGGGGILGLTYRYFLTKKNGIEGGIFYRPGVYENYYGDYTTTTGTMVAFGPVFYLKDYKNGKGKIKKNGISVKAGISPFGELNEFFGSANWVHDTYRPENKNRYFSFELGAGFDNRYNMPYDIARDVATTIPMLYWKLNWFFGM